MADADARSLHFRDPRPPHAIRCALEREHMVLLRPRMEEGKLVLSAETKVNGAACRLALCYEAALPDAHAYSLRIEIAWDGLSESAREYHQQAAPGWFDLWLRHYTAAQPPAAGAGSRERYEAVVQETLAAESHLVDVPAVQREVLDGLRRGGGYSTSHKEGGTRIRFRGGRFVREDYGESDGREAYADDAAFLAFLRRFYDRQTSRATYPEKVDELTAWKLILRLQDPPDRSSAPQSGGGGGCRTLREPRGGGRSFRLAMLAARFVLAGIVAGYFGSLAHRVFEDSLLFPFALTFIGLGVIWLGILWQRNEQAISQRIRSWLPRELVERRA